MHITSQWESPCNDCGSVIAVGEKADWIRGQKGVWCLSCHSTSTPLPGGQRRRNGNGHAAAAPANGQASATAVALIAAMTSLEGAIRLLTAALHVANGAALKDAQAQVNDRAYRV